MFSSRTVYVLKLLQIGGFNGYVCYVPIGSKPPEPEPDRPVEGTDAEGDEIL